MIRKAALVVAFATLVGATAAHARDIHFVDDLTDKEFRSLAREAGAAIAYRNAAPAASLGVTGFDAGVEVSAVDIHKESAYWKSAFGNDAPSALYVPSLRVRKGLPFGIDVGARYAYVPDSNIKIYGAEISKALLEGTPATPAVGIRATYSRLAGVNDLRLQTVGIDASVSKGILFLTPYAGIGGLFIDGKAHGRLQDLSGKLQAQVWQPRYFGGIQIKPLPLVRVFGEAEYSERPIYTLKVAVGF